MNYILDSFKILDFTTLSEKDLLMVLEWRNHPDIRNVMVNSDIISKDNHLNFVRSLQQRDNDKYWLVCYENHYLGVMSLVDIKDGSASSGMYCAPTFLKSGVGVLLEALQIYFSFEILHLNSIYSKVLKNNKSILRTHRYFGFNITECDSCYNIFMTLDDYIQNKTKVNLKKISTTLFSGSNICE